MLRCLTLRDCWPHHRLPALGRPSRDRSVPSQAKFHPRRARQQR